jgi:signal transduction histidine kinase
VALRIDQGLVRESVMPEHQGQLVYEGNRHGAVFTVVLPPFR